MQTLQTSESTNAVGNDGGACADSSGLESTGRGGIEVDRFAHQEKEVQEHALDSARSINWSPRTGKTRAIVRQSQILEEERGVKKTLIIAPQFAAQDTWPDEISAISGGYIHNLSSGPIEQRIATLRYNRNAGTDGYHHYVIVNWDALAKMIDEILRWGPQLVVADEAHYAKSAGAARTRALHRLTRAPYRRTLTGTPTPKNYVDLYAQYKFLDPRIFGTRKDEFEKRYVEYDDYKRVRYYRHLPELKTKFRSIASIFDRAKEWKDLPPQVMTRRLSLPREARELYDKVAEELVAEYEGGYIDATHKLTKLIVLQELTAGFIRDENGNVHWVHTTKIDAAANEMIDLAKSGEKAVLFYHFHPEGQKVVEIMRKELPKDVAWISGQTPPSERKAKRDAFQKADSPKIMVMQDSLGVGISLNRATYLGRLSYPMDYAAYVQSNDRIYSPDTALTYIEFDTMHTVDQFNKKLCSGKGIAQDELLGLREIVYG